MAKKPKRVRQPAPTSAPKQANFIGPASIEGRHLAWRFSNSDLNGPFSWGQATEADRHAVWTRLGEFEKMTVNQLRDTRSHHHVLHRNLSREAKVRLQELQFDDLEELFSFRINATARMWCIKHENIYSVLWWDPNHKVYPVSR